MERIVVIFPLCLSFGIAKTIMVIVQKKTNEHTRILNAANFATRGEIGS